MDRETVDIEMTKTKTSPHIDRQIVVLTGSHLCHNPRAVKEADTLASAGFDVELLGAWASDALAAEDRVLMNARPWKFTVVADLRTTSQRGVWRRRISSLRRKAANYRNRFLHWPHQHQLGYVVSELLRAARLRHGLFIAHSEQALWVAMRLNADGHAVGVDMEDWFSADLSPDSRRSRPTAMIEHLERTVLERGLYRLCTSHAMSKRLATAYGVAPPKVIYNVFPWADHGKRDGMCKDRRNRYLSSIHWFSQTLGAGRGLEQLLGALPLLTRPVEVHLRGVASSDWPQLLAKHCAPEYRKAVFVHSLVSNDELPSRIAEHDIGFAGEQRFAESRDLTVTNKLFQYLLSGLAVVATNTTGQREIASQVPSAIRICDADDSAALAKALNPWLENTEALQAAKEAALCAARERFCWEVESKKLIAEAEAAVATRASISITRGAGN